METTLVAPRRRERTPASPLAKVAAGTMVILAVSLTYLMLGIIGFFIPPLAVFAAIALVIAGAIMMGWRWVPALASVLAVLMFVMNGEPMISGLKNPAGGLAFFALVAILVPALVVGFAAGIAATIQNYRRAAEDRTMPRGVKTTLIVGASIIAGAIVVAAVPQPGVLAGIDPQTFNALPTVATKNFEFEQKELRVKAGETVALKLTNADGEAHYLDIDELNVHAPIPAGKEALAVFKPTKPGTYTFYCHPHVSPDKKEGMVGTLIVE